MIRVVFLFSLINIAVSVRNDNLVAVVQIYRHGHRTPNRFYANDPYKNQSYWDGVPMGELTQKGVLDQYALGQFTRHRYADWLPKIYSKEDFFVTSTNVARCRASAVSNINGLYSEDIDRNKIPINYSINRTLAGHAPMSCRLYYKDRANLIALKEIIAIDNKYSDLYAYLTKYTGNNVTSCRDLLHIFEGLDIEEAVNLPLPDWSRKIYPEPIAHLVGISLKSYTNTSRQQRLGIGPFMKEVVDYLEKMAEDPKSSQKFQMYSCHDFNIYSILSAFGAYDPPYPIPFAASIYIELRKNDSNYYINVFSKNKDDFKQITIRDCDFDCPLKEVREKLKDVIVDIDKREEECKEKLEFVNELAAYNYNQYFIGVVGNLSKSTTA